MTGSSWRERGAPLSRRARSLSAVVLITASGLLVAFATREAPKTSGIVELTPQERARYDRAIARVIEQIEVKYGFRQPLARRSTESTDPGPAIDEETIKEIESYYAQKNAARRTQAPGGMRLLNLRPAMTPTRGSHHRLRDGSRSTPAGHSGELRAR